MSKTATIQINHIFHELSQQNVKLKTHLINAKKVIQILIKFKNYLTENKCESCHSSQQLIQLENEFSEKLINKAIHKLINESVVGDNQVLDNTVVIEGTDQGIDQSNGSNNGVNYLNIIGNYECHTCGHEFRHSSQLKRHLSTHINSCSKTIRLRLASMRSIF